jgi:30S ribosomal protein S31
MGKGDKKSRKGKISMGSYGVTRPRKKKTAGAAAPKAAAPKAAKKAAAPKKAAPKKAAKKSEE